MFNVPNMYAIILAGEEDWRLASLTRALSGAATPKQYARIAGEGSLLQQTVRAYATMLSPKRVIVVVSTKREDLAREQLRSWRGINVLARQRDGGPALDLLLGVERIITSVGDATVVVAPGNAYLPRANALVAPLVAAEPALTEAPVILAGVPVNGSVLGERVVLPGPRRTGRVMSVQRMVEDVRPKDLHRFKELGALWDTSTLISRATTLWQLIAEATPAELAAYAAPAHQQLAARLAPALWHGLENLGVIAVQGSGWSAWTSSEQVMDSLRDPLDLELLLSRIYQQQLGIDRPQIRRRFLSEAKQRSAPRCAVLDNYRSSQ